MRDKHLATAPGQSVHATEVDYLYDTHAVRTADYNAIRSEIQSLQKSLRERDSESFNVETGVRGAANASRRECECRRFPLLGPSVERVGSNGPIEFVQCRRYERIGDIRIRSLVPTGLLANLRH